MSLLHTAFLEKRIPYTGVELAPHWVAGQTGIFASGIVAFRGPCLVETGELVDLEDRLQGARIEAREMLHFLGEWFEGDLLLAVARQRLLIAGFAEELGRRLPGKHFFRRGNDLYLGAPGGKENRKLSVSIVTASPVSTLFHFGVNIDAAGAPVAAVGLAELGVDADALARAVLTLWSEEWASMARARCKVAPR